MLNRQQHYSLAPHFVVVHYDRGHSCPEADKLLMPTKKSKLFESYSKVLILLNINLLGFKEKIIFFSVKNCNQFES